MSHEPTSDQIAKDYTVALEIIDRMRTEKAELLAACKAFVYWYDQDPSEQRRDDFDDAYDAAVATIAKCEVTS